MGGIGYLVACMIRMKALKSFRGSRKIEGFVQRGHEFITDSDQRAKDLEVHGLAYRLEYKMEPPHPNKMEAPPLNKAASEGPFVSDGGGTGADEPAPSSPQDLPRRRRRSRSSEDDLLS